MPREPLAKKHILVVEDDPQIAQATRQLLWLFGHAVEVASDGASGFEKFQNSSFDLVITDYRMPRMAGDKLAENIKRVAPAQPVLMVSGSVGELHGCPPGVDALLKKPYGLDSLRRAVSDLLERPVSDKVPGEEPLPRAEIDQLK